MKLIWGRSINFNLQINGMEKFSPDTWSPMKVTSVITDGCDCYPWRQVFAWLPTKTVSGKYVWGVKLYKRKVWLVWGNSFHMEPEVQYATLFDILEGNDDVLGKGH